MPVCNTKPVAIGHTGTGSSSSEQTTCGNARAGTQTFDLESLNLDKTILRSLCAFFAVS
ncbi:hypothetical protein PGTUg99_034743 [Puccinia graminis f. sp. tritici]|uniref:Uncharacterized protein n=1 Tax=Puccinia graminis f. sp. tritici TaxID=56615 RepID=A0A5B0SEH4_PUCGR|nr:hypothetical protein PGTUg99_034743 [Puccinia graminis f. sp. tritici]